MLVGDGQHSVEKECARHRGPEPFRDSSPLTHCCHQRAVAGEAMQRQSVLSEHTYMFNEICLLGSESRFSSVMISNTDQNGGKSSSPGRAGVCMSVHARAHVSKAFGDRASRECTCKATLEGSAILA